MDIVELLENLNVSWHQEAIIHNAIEEIIELRKEKQEAVDALYKAGWIIVHYAPRLAFDVIDDIEKLGGKES